MLTLHCDNAAALGLVRKSTLSSMNTLLAFFLPFHVRILVLLILGPYLGIVPLFFPKTNPKITHTHTFQPCPHITISDAFKSTDE